MEGFYRYHGNMGDRIERGIAAINADIPGLNWSRRVDLDTLDINDISKCVLGQVYGDFLVGLRTLDIHITQSGGSVDCGFCESEADDGESFLDYWKARLLQLQQGIEQK